MWLLFSCIIKKLSTTQECEGSTLEHFRAHANRRIYCNERKHNTTENSEYRLHLNASVATKSLKPSLVHEMKWVAWHSYTLFKSLQTWFLSVIFNRHESVQVYCLAQGHLQTYPNTDTQTLAQGCLQLQADWGHIYDVLLLWSSHHILFLISQPCNPVWHKDGCWCWLGSNMEQRTKMRRFLISERSAVRF